MEFGYYILTSTVVTLKELINAALIFAGLIFADICGCVHNIIIIKRPKFEFFYGTNFCGCLILEHFASLIFVDEQG